MIQYHFPTVLFFGADALIDLTPAIQKKGLKSLLMVTDPGLVHIGLTDSVKSTLTSSGLNIKIFDLLGRNIFNHKQNFNAPGKYRFQWHGLHDSGTPIASGVYLVTIQHKTNIFKQKITFLK